MKGAIQGRSRGKMSFCVVLITASSSEEAEKITRVLVEEKLAACVSQVPGVKSTYWWKGKVETASEILLVAKTLKTKVKTLIKAVKKNHSYSVPEVIALRIKDGNKDYLKWIQESLDGPEA
jgi:periplasmic divalent cation tolerance protein